MTVSESTRAVEVFQFPPTGQEIRTIIRDGEPLFCVADVCRGLQHSNPSVALKLTDEDDRVKVDLRETDSPSLNRTSVNPEMWFVTESGFFALALASQAPGAKAFRRWVTHEVLPTIRKTGSYGVSRHVIPQSFAQALELAARQAREIEEQGAALAIAEPKAEAWDVLASAEGDLSLRQAAYVLDRDPAIDTGQNRLAKIMRDLKMIDATGTPYAAHVKHRHLRIYTSPDRVTGEDVIRTQVRVTVAGVKYLHKKLGGIRQPAFTDLPREVFA